ncbi:hypothetical protein EDD16DRAFT_1527140 [Pisolithus croceorrhizus]|nr:hypothetical protein EDD16DRAFT_1527140 [Pisolithus croceorrhizus]
MYVSTSYSLHVTVNAYPCPPVDAIMDTYYSKAADYMMVGWCPPVCSAPGQCIASWGDLACWFWGIMSVPAVQVSIISCWLWGLMSVPAVQKMLKCQSLPTPNYIMPTSPKSQSPAADPALSALVDIALTSVLRGSPLTPSSVIQRSDLQKPRFAEPKRNVEDKTKYFPYPQWGLISDPATILDVHGRVVVWYLPGIMSPARVEHLNKIHLPLKDSLVKCSKTGGQSKRRFGHRHVPEGDGNEMFGYGHLMNSPETFQQAHMHFWRLIDPQRLEDKVYESSSLKKAPVRQWLQDISYAEEFWNTIAEIVLPDLAQVGKDAISVREDWVVTQPPSPIRWPSIYLGIDVIVNQETSPHLDQVSAPPLLDLVPGTMIYLAGKLLTHSVPKLETGERIALAHYMKDAVHNRFGLARPAFTKQKDLLERFLQT